MNTLNSSQAQDLLDSLGGSPQEESPQEESIQTPSNTYSPGPSSGVEERARTLLGSGINAEAVAAALGVTPARIAQLLSNREFADSVAELRYQNLQKHNIRDDKYDSLEDTLLEKLEKSVPLLFKPTDILNALTKINGAKRRGQASPDSITNPQNIVNLVLPVSIAQKFSVNVDNQVTRAGEQELMTMPSGNLLKKVEDTAAQKRLTQENSQEVSATIEVNNQCETTDTDQEEQLQS